MEHVNLWEEKFTKKETDKVNELHYKSKKQKKQIATEDNYKLLKQMLEDVKND